MLSAQERVASTYQVELPLERREFGLTEPPLVTRRGTRDKRGLNDFAMKKPSKKKELTWVESSEQTLE